jgi:hypothetical protein
MARTSHMLPVYYVFGEKCGLGPFLLKPKNIVNISLDFACVNTVSAQGCLFMADL